MPDQNSMRQAIQSVICAMMDRVLDKVLVQDPFIPDCHHAKSPLYAALVPDEIFKGSHFERRFVTPFGTAWEQLALVAAKHGAGHGEAGRQISGTVKAERLRRITEVLNDLEHGGEDIPVTVVCDVYVEDRSAGMKYAFELKAPLPNSDQTKVSKEKILKLYSMLPRQVDDAYYALPYNPYGKREDYKWSFPARWFDMQADPVVLIGNEFWDKIGGEGTYESFIAAVNEIGPEYKRRIYKEYLGMVPPPGAEEMKL
ncbi:MAG: TdeIII family type II restriction endonuclease [Armatimonadetes bacterium]|nr:TdeIII family type II restriction endonuclease [Armatimonadota bacterium]